ncbi:MAG: hypothetical protein OXH54_08480 [Acidimicrobiaceae bacterium]|nr:hypothetical protein [Acidimicrobiaceae bacterium]MDE0493957.1 hypothetical protein [Acidimicrobiaceae bacterium]
MEGRAILLAATGQIPLAIDTRLCWAWLREKVGESELAQALGWVGLAVLGALVLFGTDIPWLALFFGGWW